MERTLGIIKPDAVQRNLIGNILSMVEAGGLRIRSMKTLRLTKRQAEGFYYVHRERPFFGSLTNFMSEGPIVVMVLEGENAVARWREIMGATNPAEAAEGTIRKLYGQSIERNSVHGSDSAASAQFEIGYFFAGYELAD
ncbi:MAG: nucleoside-diphosphate kinase [Acidobacteriota bacterium]